MSSFIGRVLLSAILAGTCSIAVAADFGRTAGSFDVSGGGGATYTIPIWTPPGPNGVTPSIAVTYNSQAGNGLGGVGWNLAAVSAIERCDRTAHQDGNAAGIGLTLNDRFCIGGNRLRLQSGTYGGANSVYYTELADYSRVTAYGTAGNGPQYFIVEAKSGLKYEYGNTTSSRVLLGSTALRWMLNKVYDRSGNNYIVTYNNATGFAVPDVISWTPTTLGGGTYRYQAKFNYINTRVDKDSYLGKVAGNDVTNRYRLESIQIKSAGVVVRKYRFAYDTSSVTSRSRMTSAKECADDAETNCFLPINFTYQAGMAGVTAGAVAAPAGSSNGIVHGRYDLNGDGKDDLVYSNGSTYQVAFGTNVGFSSAYNTGISGTTGILIDRFLPNGRDAIATSVGGTLYVYRWNDATSSFVGDSMGISKTINISWDTSADYDGDGLADLVTNSSTSLTLRRNTSTGSGAASFAASTTSAASLASYGASARYAYVRNYFGTGLRKADMNGDNRQEIFSVVLINIYNGQGQQIGVANYNVPLLGSSSGFTVPPQPWNNVLGITAPTINFNNDACTDRLGGATIYVSACNGAAESTVATPATPLQVLDWDGDGKTDILVNSGGSFAVYLSTGTGFSGPIATSISSTGTFFSMDQDGDRQDDLIKLNGTAAISYWTHTVSGSVPTTFATNVPDLMATVADGFGISHSPGYVSTAWSSYSQGAAAGYPYQESRPRLVVAQVTSSDGVGGTFNKTYSYTGARDHAQRNEFIGFQRIDETDNRNGLIQRTYFDQTFPVGGMISQTQTMQPNGTTVINQNVITNSFATLDGTTNNQRYFVYPSASTATEYAVSSNSSWNGFLVRTVQTANSFETTGGTLYDQTVTTTEPASGANGVHAGGSWVARTHMPTANLVNNTTNWCLGRPGKIEQINSSNLTYGTSITRTTDVSWNTTYCRPTQTVAESGNGTLQVTTAIGYDSFGNVNSTSVTGTGMAARTTTTTYSDSTFTTGQFPLSVTNALSQTSTVEWDYALGVPVSSTDPNGISTFWEYDVFGRRTREDRPDGTASTWDVSSCGASCVNSRNKTKVVETVLDDGGNYVNDMSSYLDQFDRQLATSTRILDGTYNRVDREYDALGRVYRDSAPCYWSGCSFYWTTHTYDLIGRPIAISRPISDSNSTLQSTEIYYEGLTTRVEDAQGKESTKVFNAAGQLARSEDHDGYSQQFNYDAFGNPKQVLDSAGNTLQSSTYNLRGMLTQRADMDMGTWNFTPNALGEVVSQTDAKSQTTTFVFDKLGRLTSRGETEGTSTWTWGTSATSNNIGRLASVSGPGYSETYTYDSLGRPLITSISADTTYQIDYTYNGLGLLDTLTYPTSTSSYRLKIKHEYQNGQLKRIRECATSTCTSFGTSYWTAVDTNARHQLEQETLGNGLTSTRTHDAVTGWRESIQTGTSAVVQNLVYEWDLVGNLKKRRDLNQSGLAEEFFYDNLYRLDYSQRNGSTNLDMAYDALGNITSKSDVGTYTYHATKKHQVTSTSNGWSFGYDGNGNMTSGRGATLTWTSYNYPASIANGTDTASFSYTPDRQYWRQISNYTSGGAATTIYVGGILEKVTTSAGTDYRHMIRAGNASIIVSRKTVGGNSVYYVTQDHLGSSSAITNSSGGILVNSSFDAFGKRRGSNWSGSPSSGDWTAIAATTRRGYTDHSMLDNLNLIHMNGRAQDPILGRFVSADPLITEPLNTQNFNRYSYVYNNPLSNIDPSGFGVVCFSVAVPTANRGHEATTEVENEDGTWRRVASGETARSYNYTWETRCEDVGDGPGPSPGGPPSGGSEGGGPSQTPQGEKPNPKPTEPPCTNGPSYGDRYLDWTSDHVIDVGPYVAALAGGVWPKSWAPATAGRPPLLGSANPLTSVPRAFGMPGAGSAAVRASSALIGLATVGIGFYNLTIELEGFLYAIPDYGAGSCKKPN